MKVIVMGSRKNVNKDMIIEAIKKSGFYITEIVSGNASDGDKFGEEYAKENGIPLRKFVANEILYGDGAWIKRNNEMGDYADALIAVFHTKCGDGTQHMIDFMKSASKLVFIHNDEGMRV